MKLAILIIVGIPLLVWVVVMVVSLPAVVGREEKPEIHVPTAFDSANAPPFSRDYTGRIWVDKKRKGFFVPIRRRTVGPPDEPEENSRRIV